MTAARCSACPAIGRSLRKVGEVALDRVERLGALLRPRDDQRSLQRGDRGEGEARAVGLGEAGLTNACESVPLGAGFGLAVREGIDFGGGLSDLIRVRWADHMLLALPDSIAPDVNS